MSTRILVTGATGNVGRHVVSGLLTAGVNVRALTRNRAAANLPPAVDVVEGDLSVPESLDKHLGGVDAVFLLCRFKPPAAVIEALTQRVKRIVFLSSSTVRDDVDPQPSVIANGRG